MILTALKKTTIAIKKRFFPERALYVVIDGVYKGEWLIRIKPGPVESVYMALPDNFTRIIPNKDFEWGLTNKVIEVVDVLPKPVYNVCLANYGQRKSQPNEQRSNSSDRREQYSAPDTLDRQQYRQTLSKFKRG